MREGGAGVTAFSLDDAGVLAAFALSSRLFVADLGIRFSWSIILIASVNFLGLGLRPPTADWGLMVSENRSIFATNPLAVLAPAAMLALLIIGVNLVGDAYVRRLGRSLGRA